VDGDLELIDTIKVHLFILVDEKWAGGVHFKPMKRNNIIKVNSNSVDYK